MATRKYKLPGVEDLNKDQDTVLRLPKEGQFLIVGGPGTGKSVVALLRLLKYKDENDYIFLVYNKVLRSASNQLASNDIVSNTWNSWYYSLICKMIINPVPEVKKYCPDYDQIIESIKNKKTTTKSLKIIIDEGQDMPPKFYESLIQLGFENFFVVADQNQQITEENSNRIELTNALALLTDDVIELKQNYRNSYDIARLAQYFFCDPASTPPALPEKNKQSISTPSLFEYDDFSKVINIIFNAADKDPRFLVGIITPNNLIREKYYNKLLQTEINLDNPKPKISTYSNGMDMDIDFSEGGVVVLNAQSVKGTEFDIVFIADVDQFHLFPANIDSIKKLFYVMISRAMKQVVLLKNFNKSCAVESILPNDESILQRKRLSNG